MPPPILAVIFFRPDAICPKCRHKAVPVVCRRWRQLANFQPLLQSVKLGITGPQHLPRLRSFCEWMLLRASQHVSHLDLKLGSPVAAEAEESTALLAAAVAACRAAGCLTELRLELSPASHTFECTSWIAALHSLRQKTIVTSGFLFVRVSLQPLTALQELTLNADELQLLPAARLPVSLTQLRLLAEIGFESLAGQVRLPCLSALMYCSLGRVEPILCSHSPDECCLLPAACCLLPAAFCR
jgi:hypothetical protein